MRFRFLLLVAALLATGCVTTPQPQRSQVNWTQERTRLEQLDHWQLSGKLAIITAKEKGSARLNWQQDGDDYRLNLTSLIGTHILELTRQHGQLTLVDREGKVHQSDNASELVYELTGWDLPIDGLPLWIKGLPGSADFTLNPDQSLASVKDGDWQIDYQSYQDQDGYRLPQQLSLQGEGTRIKLQVNEWSLK